MKKVKKVYSFEFFLLTVTETQLTFEKLKYIYLQSPVYLGSAFHLEFHFQTVSLYIISRGPLAALSGTRAGMWERNMMLIVKRC